MFKHIFLFALLISISGNFTINSANTGLVIIPENTYNFDYKEIFGDDYRNALNYFKENYELQKKIFKYHNVDPGIIIPVLFPERIRYSIIRDYFETAFLETVYKDLGSEYVDFSIGDFQMKPSFIEKLEQEIKTNYRLKDKYNFLLIEKFEGKEKREKRINNLKSKVFQLNYISAFYDLIITKFDLNDMTNNDKIIFFASAYNYGFDNSKNEIIEKQKLELFPYGSKYPGKQYSYTDVALDFYLNYYSQLSK